MTEKSEIWNEVKEADPDGTCGMKWTLNSADEMKEALIRYKGIIDGDVIEEEEEEPEPEPEPEYVPAPKAKKVDVTHRTVIPLISIGISRSSSDPKCLCVTKNIPGHEKDGFLILARYDKKLYEKTKDIEIPVTLANKWHDEGKVVFDSLELQDFLKNPTAFKQGMRTPRKE